MIAGGIVGLSSHDRSACCYLTSAVLGSRRGRLLSENGGSVRDSSSNTLRISGYVDPPSQGSHTLTIYIPGPTPLSALLHTCRCCTPPEQTLLSALTSGSTIEEFEKEMKELGGRGKCKPREKRKRQSTPAGPGNSTIRATPRNGVGPGFNSQFGHYFENIGRSL